MPEAFSWLLWVLERKERETRATGKLYATEGLLHDFDFVYELPVLHNPQRALWTVQHNVMTNCKMLVQMLICTFNFFTVFSLFSHCTFVKIHSLVYKATHCHRLQSLILIGWGSHHKTNKITAYKYILSLDCETATYWTCGQTILLHNFW